MYERFQSEGIQPSLKILFARFVTDLMVSLPADLIILITILDGPAALPVFIFVMAFKIVSCYVERWTYFGVQVKKRVTIPHKFSI